VNKLVLPNEPRSSEDVARPKETSWGYGEASQARMADKFRNRANNHWRERIALAKQQMESVSDRFQERKRGDVIVLDVGCSIGTFAIEFAGMGYQTFGVDFDPVAIRYARQLAAEEKVEPTFIQMDVADWTQSDLPRVDVAVCFDIFEHLHDDEIGSLLQCLKRALSPTGVVLFSTTPTQYHYLYDGKFGYFWPLRRLLHTFSFLREEKFEKLVRMLGSIHDAWIVFRQGVTWREKIKRTKHCNPLTAVRLEDIFTRAGFRMVSSETLTLHAPKNKIDRSLARHSICHSHIIGVAEVRS
jgi:2-polyprenyl-3-methyl-5-hydroxy-6-metoxy-1,4-benzoquinol methylase